MPRLLLGLGNPGPEYRATRHNVGFLVLEEVARRRGLAFDREECGARTALGSAAPAAEVDFAVRLALPQTFMNRSGHSARCLVELYGYAPQEILVVYDEVALPLGRLRIRRSGSPAGHRGIESILQSLRTDEVPRLRCGVAPEAGPPAGEELADFVLSPFEEGEREAVTAMVARAADACECWLAEGVDVAMTRFNG